MRCWPLPDEAQLAAILDDCLASLPKTTKDGAKVKRNLDNGARERLLRAMSGLTEFEAQSVLAVAVIVNQGLDENAIPVIIAEKCEIIKKSGYDVFFADLSGQKAREEILSIHPRQPRRALAQFDLATVTKKCDGCTGAELEKIVAAAHVAGWDDGEREIATDDLLQAAREIIPISAVRTT